MIGDDRPSDEIDTMAYAVSFLAAAERLAKTDWTCALLRACRLCRGKRTNTTESEGRSRLILRISYGEHSH